MFRLGAASVASKSEPRFENRVINDCEPLKVELAPTNGGIVTYEMVARYAWLTPGNESLGE